MVKISVIVPIYNVEQYIERCVRSLFEQTLEEMEFIFVDDCTPDRSIDILTSVLEEYPKRKGQTFILKNEKNRGQIQTRSRGQLMARGEYLAAVDPDDWIDTDAYERLYTQIKAEESDCLIFGYYREFRDHTELCKRIFTYTNGRDFIKNYYKFPFEFFTWCVLIKNNDYFKNIIRGYYDNPQWEHVTMWEDVAVMFPYYYGAKKISYAGECFYHYNKANENSTVNTQNIKKINDALKVVDHLKVIFTDDELRLSLNSLEFGAKNGLLGISGIRAWKEEHKECNRYVMKYTSIPLKIRILYLLMLHGFGWIYDLRLKLKNHG